MKQHHHHFAPRFVIFKSDAFFNLQIELSGIVESRELSVGLEILYQG